VAALKAKYVGMPAPPSMDDVRSLVRSAPHVDLCARLAAVNVEGAERGESLVDIS
jgi:hypothetical protein